MSESAAIALAIGDPNGIGPEIAVKAAMAKDGPRLILFGDAHVVQWYAARCAPDHNVLIVDSKTLPGRTSNTIEVRDVAALARADFSPSSVTAAAGAATIAYATEAIKAAIAQDCSAVIACPHSETAINASGKSFSGYPGLVAEVSGLPVDEVYLMLIGGGLRIVHVTLHENLSAALKRITTEHVVRAAHSAFDALTKMGIDKPRIGVMGINPHAGENGLFGSEDESITAPAVAALRAEGLPVEGPQGADLLLTRDDIDVFVAMYHDQGHIPVKLKAGRHSAAMSLGAGLVFSSVGHGSGFDIAGQLLADPAPILKAIHLVSAGTVLTH